MKEMRVRAFKSKIWILLSFDREWHACSVAQLPSTRRSLFLPPDRKHALSPNLVLGTLFFGFLQAWSCGGRERRGLGYPLWVADEKVVGINLKTTSSAIAVMEREKPTTANNHY